MNNSEYPRMQDQDFEDDLESELTLKEIITADPGSLLFAGVSDTHVDIIEEDLGKSIALGIETLQWLIQEYIKYRSKDTGNCPDRIHLLR